MKFLSIQKKYFIAALAAAAIITGVLITLAVHANFQIARCAEFVHDSFDTVPAREFGLLLGTSKTLRNGRPNLYFRYRIGAAVELYRSGKISKILVSGDNGRIDYNEPEDMRNALIEAGIPAEDIIADYAGFRTLDSVVRAHKCFGLKEYVVISQKFHCERAVYLARAHDIDAVGFAARDVPLRSRIRRHLRETAARFAAWIDIMLNRQPRFPQ